MKTNILKVAKTALKKSTFAAKKYSPEILLVTGVVGVVGSVVLACKATIKAQDVIKESKENIDKVHECENDKELVESGKYTAEDAKKDMTIIYTKTALDIAKVYAPAVILGALSLTGIVASNNILRKRNVALAAAYTAVDKSFKEYRGRVIEKFGEKMDKELRYNIKAKEVEETVVDKKGNTTTVKKTVQFIDPTDISDYARFFDKYTVDEKGEKIINRAWSNDPEVNLAFLKAQQNYANNILIAEGRLFLNDVYSMLGLPKTKAGQIVGWVYDEKNPKGDNFVDFGIYKYSDNFDDFVNGFDPILLDFNVDGNIWELM